jgi:hypothetical protein
MRITDREKLCDLCASVFQTAESLKHRGTEGTENLESEFNARISAVMRRPMCNDLVVNQRHLFWRVKDDRRRTISSAKKGNSP